DREAHLGDAEVAPTPQRHRAFDAPCHQVAVRRLVVGEPELAAEVAGRHVRAVGERLEVQRLRVLAVGPVADAAQPPLTHSASWLNRIEAQFTRCATSASTARTTRATWPRPS